MEDVVKAKCDVILATGFTAAHNYSQGHLVDIYYCILSVVLFVSFY